VPIFPKCVFVNRLEIIRFLVGAKIRRNRAWLVRLTGEAYFPPPPPPFLVGSFALFAMPVPFLLFYYPKFLFLSCLVLSRLGYAQFPSPCNLSLFYLLILFIIIFTSRHVTYSIFILAPGCKYNPFFIYQQPSFPPSCINCTAHEASP
jgi:hypothetical protein